MADVDINKFRASVVREGSKPASPGFIVSEGQSPTDPAGSGQNHLPVTIATAATGLSITESQVLGGAGNVGQYIRGDGSLADFPESSGGGSSVSYYLNGSVAQGTIGGVAYKELNKVPILGAGTDFTINADGYIASFITDAGDPNLLEIPGGNWNFETYFSASSGGGSPSFYVELYKVNSGGTATLIASNSGFPELIAFGTNIISYFSTLAVPTTTLALTDRLAIRYYVNHSGRTITLHTEDNHLCQIITTFTTGITALNGLTAQVQNLAVGTSGTDFNIASATATHTFNLPTASATNRGALSSADWSTFNGKENAITAGTTAQYFRGDKTFQTLNTAAVPELTNLYYTEARVNANTNVAANTAARHNAVTLGTANGLSLSTQVLSLGLASAGVTGALSGTDWSTFNNKQNALTNPVTGTGTSGQVAYFTGTTAISSESNLFWDSTNDRLGIATNTPATTLEVNGVGLFTGGALTGNTKNGVYIYDTVIVSLAGGNARPLQIQGQTLSFFTGTTYTEKLKVFENGNVVISTSPTDNGARLQVSGTATVSSNIAIGGTITSLSDTDELSIFAGTTIVDNRARIELYGPSHATLANQTFVRGSQITFTSSASSTQYMRITSGGQVQIVGTAGTLRLGTNAGDFATLNYSGGGTSLLNEWASTSAFVDVKANGVGFRVSGTGNATLTGTLTQGVSDKRFKKNIQSISNPLEKIKSINGCTFEYDLENKHLTYIPKNGTDVGVIAQEVQLVMPEAVSIAPIDRNNIGESKSGKNYLTVNYEKLIPLLIESIKELKKEIDTLKN